MHERYPTYMEPETSEHCVLDEGEYVTQVEVTSHNTNSYKHSIEITTTHKTCGPYGNEQPYRDVVKGHMLLFVGGRIGQFFDRLGFFFASDCSREQF